MQDMDLDIRHAPSRIIQAVDALSRMPSDSKLLTDHPNRRELKRPRRELLVLNVPLHCHPLVSDLFLDAQEVAGRDDELVNEPLAACGHNNETAGVPPNNDSGELTDQLPTVENPVQFAFPQLVDDDEGLCRNYLHNVTIMAHKQQHSADFKVMWNYLKFGTLPIKTRVKQTVLVDHQKCGAQIP